MKVFTISALFCFLANLSFAQTTVFHFESEMCEHAGTYDKKKYTEQQLFNTYNYLTNSNYLMAPATMWNLGEEYKLSQSNVNQECNERLSQLNSNKFVETKFWKQAKANRIRETEELCRLKTFTIAAHKNPDTLKLYKNTDSIANYYRSALIAGGDQLLDAWKVLNESMKRKNGFPEKVQQKFDERYNSPERLEYAKMEVITYGWWNSCNKLLFRSEEKINYFTEFEKLFVSVKTLCEDMD